MTAQTRSLAPSTPASRFGLALLLAILALLFTVSLTGGPRSAHAAGAGLSLAVPIRSASEEVTGQEIALVPHAPNVPPPNTRTHPTRVIVNLETTETIAEIADSV